MAHSILVSVYWLLLRHEPYQELGAHWLARREDEARVRRLIARLERLGHTVVLDRAAKPNQKLAAEQQKDGLRPRADARLQQSALFTGLCFGRQSSTS